MRVDRTGPKKSKEHGDLHCSERWRWPNRQGQTARELAERIVKAFASALDIRREGRDRQAGIYQFLPQTERLPAGDRADSGRRCRPYVRRSAPGKRVQVEFVSANPTRPLHTSATERGAAYGAAVADLLTATGFSVHREYYVNDAGRQMDILATSVWLRYLELCGEKFIFRRTPTGRLRTRHRRDACTARTRTNTGIRRQKYSSVPADEPQGGDKGKTHRCPDRSLQKHYSGRRAIAR